MRASSDAVIERVKVREVAGVFHAREALDRAIEALLLAGFDRADIDLMASADAVRERLGSVYVAAPELADVPDVPRRAFIPRREVRSVLAGAVGILTFIGATVAALGVVASGGALALATAAAAAGGGAAGGVGVLAMRRFMDKEEAGELEAQVVAGGLVLWIRVRSAEREERAQRILREHGADAVRVHEIAIGKHLTELPLSAVRPDPWLGDERLGEVR
jgi:hypothetical protein